MTDLAIGVPTAKPAPASPRDYHFPAFSEERLSNGIRVVVAPVAKLPLVSVLALLEAGASTEPDGQYGVASLTARLLMEGAAGLDGAALADRFEQLGAAVEAHADWDMAEISITTMANRLPDALALVRDLIRAPTFPQREVDRLKEERLSDLLQQLAEPRGLADEQFAHAVYEEHARYASPEGGDVNSVRRLTREHVQEFYSTRYAPDSMTLIFAGDITMEGARSLADSLFGDWTAKRPSSPQLEIDRAQRGRQLRVVSKADAPQSEVRVGHRGLSRNIPDYFDVMVMNAVLGGLFSSRINLNLREAHGYTYGATSAFDWRRGAGPFVVQTAVKTDVTGAAVHEILSEIDRMRTDEISNDELTLATSYLDGVFPIRYETTAAIANALATLIIHDLPETFLDTYRSNVRTVTTEGILQAARRHLDPANLRIVVVGDAASISEALEAATGLTADIVVAT